MGIVDLPLRRVPAGHLLTRVSLDGAEPLDFVIDTAASGTVLSTKAVPPGLAGRIETVPDAFVRGAGGKLPEELRSLRATLEIGSHRIPEIALTVLDLTGLEAGLGAAVDGVLGLDVLGMGDLWLDLSTLLLRLSPGPEATAPARQAPLRFLRHPFQRSSQGLITFQAELGSGASLALILDLGAAVSVINEAAGSLATALEATATGSTASALGVDNRGAPALRSHLGPMRLGTMELPGRLAYISELPIFAELGLTGPVMLLGLDALQGRQLGISFSEEVFFLSTGSAGPED
jgi:Aspartyl protease